MLGFTAIALWNKKAPAAFSAPPPAPKKIACLGRIIPEGLIIHLAPPASSYPGPSPVALLLVKEGDRVTNGQAIAVLENNRRLKTSWQAADAQASVAEKRLEQVRAGVKPSEIAAQKSEIAVLMDEQHAAEIDFERKSELRKLNTISLLEWERSQLALGTSRRRLENAQQKLESLQEIRPVDLALAEAQWKAAQAEAEHSAAEVEQSIIRSPIDGQVIKILTRPGEIIGKDGVAELAKTQSMMVLAEVYETDVRWIRSGQTAQISGPVLPQALQGVVEQIGLKVGRNQLFTMDPAAADDARVVEVKIRLPAGAPVQGLIHAEVTVIFDSGGKTAASENGPRKI